MNINEIREKIRSGVYEISFHAEKERYAENITIKDLENAVQNGEILESYPEDTRGKSCLILGYSESKPIHIVCGCSQEKRIRIITVYLPKAPKWINEKTRAK